MNKIVLFLSNRFYTTSAFCCRSHIHMIYTVISPPHSFSIRWDLQYEIWGFFHDNLQSVTVTSFPHFSFNSHLPFLRFSSHFVGLTLHLHLCNVTSFFLSFLPSICPTLAEPILTKLLLVLQFHSLSCLTCCRAKPGTVHYLLQKNKYITTGKRLHH